MPCRKRLGEPADVPDGVGELRVFPLHCYMLEQSAPVTVTSRHTSGPAPRASMHHQDRHVRARKNHAASRVNCALESSRLKSPSKVTKCSP